MIQSRLIATGLNATVSGGTLTLNNVRGAAANNIDASSTFTVTSGGTLERSGQQRPVQRDDTASSLGNARVALNGGTLTLRGNLVAGGLTGQVYQVVGQFGPPGNLANINNTHPDFVTATGALPGLPAATCRCLTSSPRKPSVPRTLGPPPPSTG